jgi:hypothetical protein
MIRSFFFQASSVVLCSVMVMRSMSLAQKRRRGACSVFLKEKRMR